MIKKLLLIKNLLLIQKLLTTKRRFANQSNSKTLLYILHLMA